PRQLAIEQAKEILSAQPVYLDTETTGLDRSDEIVEISIIDHDGQPLFESLVKPSQPIPPSSTQVHGIRNEDVQNARAWPIVWQQVQNILRGRRVVMYNVEFDIRLMQQSHARYRLPWNYKIDTVDLLKLYAQFRGEWDSKRRSYRYHSLANAGEQCGISLPNAHRATADTLLTRAVLEYIANCE
ncbi:MAG: 3'-5' exonuclease, partial [Anaerolineaceae bacterium]|nr:3'-5' exonuclease [Anaerolineaceae bacterium]